MSLALPVTDPKRRAEAWDRFDAVATRDGDVRIESLFETEAGRVERLTLFDFGTLPAARPRVRQFVVPDLACEALGRVLFNGAETCTGAGLAEGACEDGLLLSSRTAVELLG